MASCAMRVFTAAAPIEYGTPQNEEIIFMENNVNARVKWKKEALAPYFRFPARIYYLGFNTALLEDGRLYYQDRHNIFVLDPSTGNLIERYDKPDFAEPDFVDLNRANILGEKKVFPLIHFLGWNKQFLVVDKDKRSKVMYSSDLEGERFYSNNRLVTVMDDAFNHIVSAFELGDDDMLRIRDAKIRVRIWRAEL